MQSLAEVRSEEFQQILTDGYIRTARVLAAALAFGIVAFGMAVLLVFLTSSPREASEASRSLINIMTYSNIAFICIFPLLGNFLSGRQFTPEALQKGVTQTMRDPQGNVIAMTPAEQCGMKIRTAWMVQAAMLEFPAFMGLQVTMLAVQNGVIAVEPMYAANLLTAVPALLYFTVTFPSADLLRSTFETRIQNRR